MFKMFSIKNLLTISIALFLLFPFYFSNSVLAEKTGLQRATEGLESTATKGFGEKILKSDSVSLTVGKIIGVVLSFVGVIFLILIIYAGFTWMLARGNEADVKKAKDLMYDAIIGLVIIMAAYAITAFVGSKLTS